MRQSRAVLLHLSIVAVALMPAAPAAVAQSATSVLDTAIVRMGGAQVTRDVKRVRFELVTQWTRPNFDGTPSADQPSYENDSDLRDYELPAWRNTRHFMGARGVTEVVDVVRDSVAERRSPGGPGGLAASGTVPAGKWTPLNIAYVEDRWQQFATAPERLLLAARDARDLRAMSDTTIAGTRYARLSATVERLPMTLLVRRSTGFLAAARYRVAEPNDYGLVPWGEMEVQVWYANWKRMPGGLVYPHQWDIRRVGQTYKRITVVSATFNPPAMPDSFAITDSVRQGYLATARRPMHDIPLDSARMVADGFAWFNTPGAPVGAVRLGGSWMLLESGQAPSSAERAMRWLGSVDAHGRVVESIVSMPLTGNGGAAWLAGHGVGMHVAPGAMPFVTAVLQGHGVRARGVEVVARGRWLRVGTDSLWLEPIDLPDLPGTLIAYSPSRQWIYSAPAANPLYLDLIMARARSNGWRVSTVGTARGPMTALPPAQRLVGTTGAAAR